MGDDYGSIIGFIKGDSRSLGYSSSADLGSSIWV